MVKLQFIMVTFFLLLVSAPLCFAMEEDSFVREGDNDGVDSRIPADSHDKNMQSRFEEENFPFNDFDHETYLELYPDVNTAVEEASQEERRNHARKHYKNWGIRSNRLYRLPEDFNAETYLALNPDLGKGLDKKTQHEREKWARIHYANHGRQESRLYLPENFDEEAYYFLNPGCIPNAEHFHLLGEDTKLQARIHYAYKGRLEEREFRFPDDFNAEKYLELIPPHEIPEFDSLWIKVIWAKEHYGKIGRKEGRLYCLPEDFDAETYLSLNPDLTKDIEIQAPYDRTVWAKQHYANQGIHEGRDYFPQDFSADTYLTLYPCLKIMLQRDDGANLEMKARIDFSKRGREEGRIYKLPEIIDRSTYLSIQKSQFIDFKNALLAQRELLLAELKEIRMNFPRRGAYTESEDQGNQLGVTCFAPVYASSISAVEPQRRHVRRSSHKFQLDDEDLIDHNN